MSKTQEQQIIDLQTRVAFQEDALQTMSDQMGNFAVELQMARKQIQLLSDKLKDTTSQVDQMSDSPADERPPHY